MRPRPGAAGRADRDSGNGMRRVVFALLLPILAACDDGQYHPPRPPTSPTPIEVDLPGQGRAYILCDGGNRVYFSPGGGVAVTLDRNECP